MTGLTTYGARGPLSDPPQLGEYEVVLACHAEAAIQAAYQSQVFIHEGASERRGYEQGQRDMLARCIDALAAVEGSYSVPVGMSVGLFIYAMRHEFIAALHRLEVQP